MISKNTFINNLELAQNLKYVNGDVVECGVWRGGVIVALARGLWWKKGILFI